MIINNGERFYNSRSFKSKNEKEDPLNADDFDLDGLGGGGTSQTPEEKEAARVEAERLAAEDGIPVLIKDVTNDYVKTLDQAKITQVIEKFEGAGFDTDGNIIDAEGNVLKSPDDIKAELEASATPLDEAEEVTLQDAEGNDVTYKLDENKNAIDAEGNVIKTKEELLEMTADDGGADDDDYVSHISSSTGFQAVDDEGNPVKYENTIEGLAAREVHIVRQEATKLASDEIKSFFDSNPDVVEMMEYKKIHGSLKDYAVHEDFSKIILDESNDDQHKSIIIKAELAKGNSEERAKTIAEFFMEDGKGKAEAEIALKFLVDDQKADNAAKLKQAADAEAEALGKQKIYFGEVAAAVKKGEAKGYKLPEYFETKAADGRVIKLHRNSIFQFITEPVTDDGRTRLDQLKSKDTVEDLILDVYLRLTGNDTSKLVAQKASNAKVIKLKAAKASASGKVNFHKSTGTLTASDIK